MSYLSCAISRWKYFQYYFITDTIYQAKHVNVSKESLFAWKFNDRHNNWSCILF